jgi:hypothetical protein
LIDGEAYFGLTYSLEGEHVLTVYDDFGNSYDYTLIIVRTAPAILYKLNGGVFNKANGDRQYAFKEALTIGIADEFGGGFAMYIVKNSTGDTLRVLSYGEEYTFNASGRYSVQAINHVGTSAEITFVLSLVSPTATFTDNADSKRLELRIEPSADSGAQLTNIEIRKSVDSGLTWTELATDDYGRTIGADKLFYEFNRDGLYRVIVEDNFRSGIDAITAAKDYLKPAPEGTLHGVIDGGYTNGTVKFTWDDEAEAAVTFDGVTEKYLSGAELTEDGSYTLTFYDANGFEAAYTFTIKTAMPTAELSIEPVNGYLTEPVFLTYEPDCTALLYKDGNLIGGYENGAELTEDGEYTITVADIAGNETTATFTLDTTPPTADIAKGGSVIIQNPSETATVELYFNGSLIPYTLGETLTEPGSYRVIVTDEAGNITGYAFEIAYAVNGAGTVVIAVLIIALIGGGIAVFLFRKRGKFKTNKAKK